MTSHRSRPLAGLLAGMLAGLLAAVLAIGLAASAAAQDLDVREVTLDNGMRVLLLARPGDPNVACGWIAHVGSVNERPGITGLSHLFEHMMFKGTRVIGTRDIEADTRINAEQDRVRGELRKEQEKLDHEAFLGRIPNAADPAARTERHQKLLTEFDELVKKQKELLVDNEMDAIYQKAGGSGLNAFTSHDFTAYIVTMPANKLELWFWMESDRLTNPVFRQFYSERDVVWEERRMRTDSTPTGKLDEQFDAMFWMASPYAWPVIGWPSDLNGITREEANSFFSANYSPSNITAALVGDFDPAQAEALARRYFGRLARSKREPAPVRTFSPTQTGVRRFEAEAETRPTVKVRWPAVQHGHVDESALSMLSDLLSGETGRLQMSLVKGSKIASAASASQDGKKYAGYVEISGTAATGHEPQEVEDAIYAEVRKLQEQPVGDRELQKVKNQALAVKYRRLDGNFTIMIQLLVYDSLGDWKNMETEVDKYLAVTAADVQRVATTYLKDGLRNVAVYRTKAKPAAVAAEEAAEAKSPDDLYSALAEPLREHADKMKEQLASASPEELAQALAGMAAARSGVPPPMAPLFDWAEAFIQSRIASMNVKGGQK